MRSKRSRPKKGEERRRRKKIDRKTLRRLIKSWGLSIVALIVFFAVFFVLISYSQFQDKANVAIGEVSLEDIQAPYDLIVEMRTQYQEACKKARDSEQPSYRVDPDAQTRIEKHLDDKFGKISQAGALETPEERIAALRADDVLRAYLGDLDEGRLEQLFVGEEDFSWIRVHCTGALATVLDSHVVLMTENQDWKTFEVEEIRSKVREEINKPGEIYNPEGSNSAAGSNLQDIRERQVPDVYKELMERFLQENITESILVEDVQKTEQNRSLAERRVEMPTVSYQKNETIVEKNKRVTADMYDALVAFDLIQKESVVGPRVGIAFEILLGMALFLFYIFRFQRALFDRRRRLVLLGIMMAVILGVARVALSIPPLGEAISDALVFLIPVAWITMMLTLLLGERVALAAGVLVVFYMLLMVEPSGAGEKSFMMVFVGVLGSFGGIISVSALERRTDLNRSGLYAAGINAAGGFFLCLILESPWLGVVTYTAVMGLNGIISSFLMIGSLPWMERAFGITSTVRLLGLADPSNELLKRMLIEAPGTYHHSIMVGNLAEAAAEKVGADPLLVRVGALYHDIGKLKRPYFFIENQIGDENPHDKLTATLSALIIISHVKDGAELADHHKLPENVKDIIVQHHGDSRASYFYMKALAHDPSIPERRFRYDGPKPMSKESAIVLLADNVEAIIRSHRGNTVGRLEALVRKIIQDKADEGLLSQSDLTFKDLSVIGSAFAKVLNGMFHSRVSYPELSSAKPSDRNKRLGQGKDRAQYAREEKLFLREKEVEEMRLLTEERGTIQPLREEKGQIRGDNDTWKNPSGEGTHGGGRDEDQGQDFLERDELEERTDEFAKTIYMTGSRFSMRNSSGDDPWRGHKVQPRNLKQMNPARFPVRRKKRKIQKNKK